METLRDIIKQDNYRRTVDDTFSAIVKLSQLLDYEFDDIDPAKYYLLDESSFAFRETVCLELVTALNKRFKDGVIECQTEF